MPPSGLWGDALPGEQVLASYREGELQVTDRRVLYRGRGWRRRELASVPLARVGTVGLRRRFAFAFNPYLSAIPLGIVFLGFVTMIIEGWEDPFFIGVLWGLITSPVALIGAGHVLVVNDGDGAIMVRVPRRHIHEAQAIVRQLDQARMTAAADEEAREPVMATARPFVG